MVDYKIITDVTADLSAEMVDKLGVLVIPMAFEMGGKSYMEYPDKREMSLTDFYSRLRNGEVSITSQINNNTFLDYLEPILKEGKDILYVGFSSGLSGTFNASLIACQDLREKYPQRKIICIDSLSASAGEGMLVYNAAVKKAEGMSIDQLSEWLLNNRLNVCQWFTVDDLGHLKRGGRVSAIASVVGTMLGVKPVLHVNNEGRLIPVTKARGRKKSLEALVERMELTCINPQEQVIFIGHGDCLDDAKLVENMIREKMKVKDVVINHIGTVIGSHSGPGTVALFFFGKER